MTGTAPTFVLVVEDDWDLAEVVKLTLEASGHEVAVARNGLEALNVVAERMPCVILLDMLMPVMDGWRFAREFSVRHGPAAPIVVVTAAEHARRRGAEIGASEVLAKPFELDALRETVRRVAQLGPRPGSA